MFSVRRRLASRATRRRNQVAHLETALATARRIGAAMGVLMAQRKITDMDAFALRAASQTSNRKLRDLAEDVIRTGELTVNRSSRSTRRTYTPVRGN